MSNPTTPFSWQMPTATDLVTDLPADFAVFGQAVATSMADLLGGASGYILSKASATDMDFTWIANDQGDITGVTAGTGMSVTDPTGPVPIVTNAMATAITTNGDLIYGTGSGTFVRLGIGSATQVLTVAGGVPSWATPTAVTAPGLAFVTSATFTSVTTVSINSCFTSTYDNYLVTVNTTGGTAADYKIKLRLSGTDSSASYKYNTLTTSGATVSSATLSAQTTGFPINASDQSALSQTDFQLFSPAVAVKTWYKASSFYSGMGGTGVTMTNGIHEVSTAYDGVTISWTNSATGTVRVYGLRNS